MLIKQLVPKVANESFIQLKSTLLKILLNLISFSIHHKIYLALAAVALTYYNTLRHNLSFNLWLLIPIFLIVVLAYHYIRCGGKTMSPTRWTILSTPIISISFWITPFQTMILVFTTILSLLYIHPVLKIPPLRNIPLIKVFLVGLAWSCITTLFPALNHQEVNYWNFLEIVCFISSLVLLFEIKDISEDKRANLTTFPIVMGVSATKLVSLLLLTIAAYIHVRIHLDFRFLVVVILNIILIICTNQQRSQYYFNCFVDGSIFLWGIV